MINNEGLAQISGLPILVRILTLNADTSSNINFERNKLKTEYLKKEVEDLQMDLDDVSTTLKINKNILGT